ncbi:quinone oxidoreductase [Motiliproteus coralliicola]|uniref:Quinone oxidoreductase n=2 Tax=Motiliproteus coralliicola TaxID=2283196 RepID=A0A369WTA5_9GAMM|nr:quinone oxidoreductase [Motiliproteus coralliicola]
MKAMIINKLGDSSVFQQVERAKPEVVAGHLVVEVKASSVNPLDIMLRSAETPWSANLPEVLHGDVAGVVVAVGEGVSKFSVGDEIYGCAGGIAGIDGALAEYMLVDADLVAHKPKRLSMAEAAALPLVSITAWEALVDKLRIQQGDSLLVHAATGGVGHVALQLGKHLGATVTVTTRSRTEQQARLLGADHTVNVEQQSVADYVEQCTAGKGFDAVFDTVAGDNIKNSFDAARYNGAVATILPIDDAVPVALKGLSFHSVLMLIPMVHRQGQAHHGEILTKVAELVDQGKIIPLIDDSQFSLWQVAEAHDRLSSGKAIGKVVLTAAP